MKKRKKQLKSCRREQALSFRTRHHLSREGLALAGNRQIRSQDLVSVDAHRTEEVSGSIEREGEDGVGIGDGDVNVNEDGDVHVDGDGDKAGRKTEVEANDGNGDESGNGAGRVEERRVCAIDPK